MLCSPAQATLIDTKRTVHLYLSIAIDLFPHAPEVLCLKRVRSFAPPSSVHSLFRFLSPLSAPSLRSLSPLPCSAPSLTPPLPLVRRALYTLDTLDALPPSRPPHSLRHAQGDTSLSPVVIEEVVAGSQAATLGVQRGDHISNVEGSTAFTDVGSVIGLLKARTRPVKVSIIS